MKRLFQLSAVATCLLLGGGNTFVSAQEADDAGTDNHDMQFVTFKGPRSLLVQTKSGALLTTSASYSQITSAGVNMQFPGYLVVTFSGESLCTGGSWCTLKVMVNGVEMNPAVGTDFAFDSPDDQWESHSVQRISNLLPVGPKVVDVLWAVVGGSTFRIDDWLLKVEYWPQ